MEQPVPETPFEPQPDEEERSSWKLKQGDEIVPGRYAIEKLGGGHDYEAYMAWDEHLAFLVVVKMLRPHVARDERAVRGLKREARALRTLAHPCLVRSYGEVLGGDRPHVVMELIEGPHLARLIRRFGRLPIEQLVPLGINLAAALHYIAGENMLHLDLKPRNVVVGSPPKLIDLSLARDMRQVRKIKGPVGTDLYMAPEQCDPQNLGPIGPPAEVWALGVTLYMCLTAERPFEREEGFDKENLKERFPQLTERAPYIEADVPQPVIDVVQACLDPDPEARPAAIDVAEGLGPALTSLPSRPVLRRLRPRMR